jgi:hypothetical protein
MIDLLIWITLAACAISVAIALTGVLRPKPTAKDEHEDNRGIGS